jgi:cytochrome c peroxidase
MRVRYGFVLSLGLATGASCVAADDTASGAADDVADATAGTVQALQSQELSVNDRVAACASDPRVVANAVSADVCVGADLFFRETFQGNGRACATCHRVDHNMTIDPAFIAQLPASDPLFVAERNAALAGLEIPDTMHRFGLILENLDGFSPDPRTRFVLRSVPHTLSLATSVTLPPTDSTQPMERTGWSGDGAPDGGNLKNFQNGAITQHYTQSLDRVVGQDFRLATDAELGSIDAFMRQIGRTNELTLTSVAMSDAGAETGRTRFLAVGCNACHGNAGANATFGSSDLKGNNRNFNTGVEAARNAALAAFPRDGGLNQTTFNSDGSIGDGTFNTPPLIEAADTGPFFHTAVTVAGASAHNADVATTIEEAIAFYDTPTFHASPSGFAVQDLSADDINNIGRFLRGLNAGFNAAQAVKRLDAELAVVGKVHNTRLDVQRELLRLANVELADAIRVLTGASNLDAASTGSFIAATALIETARTTGSEVARLAAVTLARQLVTSGSTAIGSKLTYEIGNGSVMF